MSNTIRDWRTLIYGSVVSAAFLGAVIYPVLRPVSADSFPLSTYPMFSRGGDQPTYTVHRAFGMAPNGQAVPLPPELVANGEVLQAYAALKQAIQAGPPAPFELCRHIALRAGQHSEYAGLPKIEIASTTYDAVRYFSGDTRPVTHQTHASCTLDVRAAKQ